MTAPRHGDGRAAGAASGESAEVIPLSVARAAREAQDRIDVARRALAGPPRRPERSE